MTIPIIVALVIIALQFIRGLTSSSTKMKFTDQVGTVLAACKSGTHEFSKTPSKSIKLVKDLGVQGDSHLGKTVQHRSRLHIRPPPKNLRQVHLMHSELFEELSHHSKNGKYFTINPGDLGENITTQGVDLLNLSAGTRLHFVDSANKADGDLFAGPVVRLTGLRNPCPQIDKFQDGLREMCMVKDVNGTIIRRKAGVMAVVERGGEVRPGAKIGIEVPDVYTPLECV